MSIIQYFKDTRGELNHVAWPTRVQTIIYTTLVMVLSVVVALYLGLFDYFFTTALSKGLQYLPQSENVIQPASTPLGEPSIEIDSTPTVEDSSK